MLISKTKLGKIWEETALTINGVFTTPYQKINGGYGGTYHFKINLQYNNFNICIYSGIDEFGLKKDEYNSCIITIVAKKKSIENINLAIWRKDFFDRIFGYNLSRTEYKEFDKIIGLKASRNIERYLPKIFENKELRKDFINDKYRAYNIQTIDDEIIIQRKSGLRMKNSEMIIKEYNKFKLFLDGLIKAKIT